MKNTIAKDSNGSIVVLVVLVVVVVVVIIVIIVIIVVINVCKDFFNCKNFLLKSFDMVASIFQHEKIPVYGI